ncbi:SH3 domain-binding glutamic acid-rich protein homolog isoform X2 [Ischnura elegans]|uniref:SH3 domain-binding glutamic acid-rich protein homolog isoform X2 n=1 Tax=Ischnura elegans TaxID=197161 RepID=UPI001ED88D04|nr:SH3 domain-binding glutamic acid-rich protein homolog isoform X2 [Ischnura elegans]
MVIKVYVSGISGNKEVKKRQQRVLMILDSKHILYDVVDITEPGKEQEKEFMQQKSNAKDAKYPLPPQIFNEEEYCGDYEEFDLANEIDELDKFLKVTINDKKPVEIKESKEGGQVNGHLSSSREASAEKEPVAEEPSPESKPEEKEEVEEEKAEVTSDSRAEAAKEEQTE